MNRRFVYELTEADVGRAVVKTQGCRCCGAPGETVRLEEWFGQVLPGDVGKRIYSVNGIYQIENDDQVARRRERLTRPADVVALQAELERLRAAGAALDKTLDDRARARAEESKTP